MSQRTAKSDNSGTFAYTRNNDEVYSTILADGAAVYNHGASGNSLLSEVRGSGVSAVSKYYHSDALGSTGALTNSGGTTTDTHVTDAFGMSVTGTGTTPTPFGFVGLGGYQSDSDTGLTLCGHRYYDASTGRFLSRDPAQAGYNWYIYCNDDPVNSTDPEGLDAPTPPMFGFVPQPPTFSPFPGIGGAIPAAPSPTFGGPTGPSLTPPPPGTQYPVTGPSIGKTQPSPAPGPPFPQFPTPMPGNPAFGPITPQPYPYAPSIGGGNPFGPPNLGIIAAVPVYTSPSFGVVVSGGPGLGINPKNPFDPLVGTGDPTLKGVITVHF